MNVPRLPLRWLSPPGANSERLPLLAAALVAAAIGWQISSLAWHLVPAPASAQAAPIEIGDRDVVDAGNRSRAARELARLSLFGEAQDTSRDDNDDSSTGPDAEPANAPETQLNLELRGLYATGEGDGFAIIETGDEGERVYTIDDEIAGNARVAGIYADRVLLRRNDRLEALWLKDAEDRPASSGGADREPDPTRNTEEVARNARQLRNDLLNNPGKLARMVRFQPYQEGGDLVGFRLRPRGQYADTLRELGLTPNDVLTEINGIPLNDSQRGQQALEELRDAQEVEVEFLRDGRRQQVTLDLGEPD